MHECSRLVSSWCKKETILRFQLTAVTQQDKQICIFTYNYCTFPDRWSYCCLYYWHISITLYMFCIASSHLQLLENDDKSLLICFNVFFQLQFHVWGEFYFRTSWPLVLSWCLVFCCGFVWISIKHYYTLLSIFVYDVGSVHMTILFLCLANFPSNFM